jgi:undecaprenyl-diphosphatase
MPIYQAIVLAIVQGATELLPVSSSAHVIVVAELFHENMSTPANALLLVMLHTGTMFAVVVYFWRRWLDTFLASWEAFWRFARLVFVASLASGIVAVPMIFLVAHILGRRGHFMAVEELFHKLNWIAPALAAGGLLILYAGLRGARQPADGNGARRSVSWLDTIVMGIVQGFAIPFRGFSRSGSTISGGLLTGGQRMEVESFSFAMGVAITPLAILAQLYRLVHATHRTGAALHLATALTSSLVGMAASFLAGLLALKWLSRWLEQGRWYLFGIYCLAAAGVVQMLYLRGW